MKIKLSVCLNTSEETGTTVPSRDVPAGVIGWPGLAPARRTMMTGPGLREVPRLSWVDIQGNKTGTFEWVVVTVTSNNPTKNAIQGNGLLIGPIFFGEDNSYAGDCHGNKNHMPHPS